MKHCLTPDEIKGKLAQVGINPTAQRIAICRFVLCEADHPTADEVKAWADENFPMISRATVYNTLSTLVEAKLLKEVRIKDSKKVMYDTNTDHHYHFYDEKTGKIFDVRPQDVKIELKLPKKMATKEIDIVIRGEVS